MPLFDDRQLGALHRVINELLPEWSTKLHVAKHEDSQRLLVGRSGDLAAAIQSVAAPKRGLGTATFTGAYEDLTFFVRHSCDPTLPIKSNHLSLEVYELDRVGQQPTCAWARQFFAAVVEALPADYANSHANQEFEAKNMVLDRNGAEAIGIGLVDYLPGLYWLNYLGPPYVDLIGLDRLLSAPAYEVKEIAGGVLLALAADAAEWQSAEYQAREASVIEHIGRKYFFSRWDPGRKTVAPDFRAFRSKTCE
jgi:hypothetical protein